MPAPPPVRHGQEGRTRRGARLEATGSDRWLAFATAQPQLELDSTQLLGASRKTNDVSGDLGTIGGKHVPEPLRLHPA